MIQESRCYIIFDQCCQFKLKLIRVLMPTRFKRFRHRSSKILLYHNSTQSLPSLVMMKFSEKRYCTSINIRLTCRQINFSAEHLITSNMIKRSLIIHLIGSLTFFMDLTFIYPQSLRWTRYQRIDQINSSMNIDWIAPISGAWRHHPCCEAPDCFIDTTRH